MHCKDIFKYFGRYLRDAQVEYLIQNSVSLKNWRFLNLILLCLQATSAVLAQDSSAGDRGPYYTRHRKQREHRHICLSPLPPVSQWGYALDPERCCSGFVSLLRNQVLSTSGASSKYHSTWQKSRSSSAREQAATWLSHSGGHGLLSCLCGYLEKLLSIRRWINSASETLSKNV